MPFANILKEREALKAAQPPCETKRFTGNGTHELEVPCLVELEYVQVGETVVPLEKSWTYLENAAGTVTKTEVLPFVAIYEDDEGRTLLLRDISSNHGIWQLDCPILVGGVWGEVIAQPANPTDGAEDETPSDPPANEPKPAKPGAATK